VFRPAQKKQEPAYCFFKLKVTGIKLKFFANIIVLSPFTGLSIFGILSVSKCSLAPVFISSAEQIDLSKQGI